MALNIFHFYFCKFVKDIKIYWNYFCKEFCKKLQKQKIILGTFGYKSLILFYISYLNLLGEWVIFSCETACYIVDYRISGFLPCPCTLSFLKEISVQRHFRPSWLHSLSWQLCLYVKVPCHCRWVKQLYNQTKAIVYCPRPGFLPFLIQRQWHRTSTY